MLLKEKIEQDGFVIIEDVLSASFVAKAKTELEISIKKEAEYHNSCQFKDFGMVLLCAQYGGVFLELFENVKLLEPFNQVLGDGCIVYAYTSSSMPPKGSNYSARIHVDCPRIIPSYITNMGATILLDDFTVENGATWYLPKSHFLDCAPDQEFFFANAKRLVVKAGSIFFFNARLWHAGGHNQTKNWRHALTINMCRPWMKQRIDIPRALSYLDLTKIPEIVLQKLGFFAQVPASYDEYYLPEPHRKFRQLVE